MSVDLMVKEAREKALDAWRDRWSGGSVNARWTKRLIKNVRPWLRTYAKRFGEDTEDDCIYCAVQDTVEHTIFVCGK